MRQSALKAISALVLGVLLMVTSGCTSSASARGSRNEASPVASSKPSGQLQEVAPPGAVQELKERLNDRAPQIDVLAPANDSTLPAGPWTLKLKVQDWPLYADETNGLGPHLVLQLDDQPPKAMALLDSRTPAWTLLGVRTEGTPQELAHDRRLQYACTIARRLSLGLVLS